MYWKVVIPTTNVVYIRITMLRIRSVLDCFGLTVQCFETLELMFS